MFRRFSFLNYHRILQLKIGVNSYSQISSKSICGRSTVGKFRALSLRSSRVATVSFIIAALTRKSHFYNGRFPISNDELDADVYGAIEFR